MQRSKDARGTESLMDHQEGKTGNEPEAICPHNFFKVRGKQNYVLLYKNILTLLN